MIAYRRWRIAYRNQGRRSHDIPVRGARNLAQGKRIFWASPDITSMFPQYELYGLAKGSGLQTKSLFSHRLGLAVGEIFEVVSGSYLALDRKYITDEQQANIYEWANLLARKINAFRATLR